MFIDMCLAGLLLCYMCMYNVSMLQTVRAMSAMNAAILHVISTPPSRRLLQQREGTCPKEAVVALEAAIHRRAYGGAFPQ